MAAAMTRGIQLKQLHMEDLVALGIPESTLRESGFRDLPRRSHPVPTPRPSAKLAQEACEELQAVLTLLEEALQAVGASPDDAPPRGNSHHE